MTIARCNNLKDFRRVAGDDGVGDCRGAVASGGERAPTLLRTEMERTMALAGCNAVLKLGRSYVGYRS